MGEAVVPEAKGSSASPEVAETGKPSMLGAFREMFMPSPPKLPAALPLAGGDEQTLKDAGSGAVQPELVVREGSGSSAALPTPVVDEQTIKDGAPAGEVPLRGEELVVAEASRVDEQTIKDGGVTTTGELAVPEGSGGTAAGPGVLFDFEEELAEEMAAAEVAKMEMMGGEGMGGGAGGADPRGLLALPVTPPARAKRAGPRGVSPAGKKPKTRVEAELPGGKYKDLALFMQPGPPQQL
jgi:hypothetical protein